MKFILLDGAEIVGNSYTDIVKAMNNQKMTPSRDLAVYRRATADRIKEAYGKDIDPTSDKTLVLGMEAAGIVERS